MWVMDVQILQTAHVKRESQSVNSAVTNQIQHLKGKRDEISAVSTVVYEATESQLKANPFSGIFLRILLLEAQISRPYHRKFNFVLNPFKNISLSERNLQ